MCSQMFCVPRYIPEAPIKIDYATGNIEMWVPRTEGASGATDYLRSTKTRGRACRMQHVSVALAERFVTCSRSIVIDCGCGEKLLLLGRKSDWRSEGHTVFECGG